MMRRIPCLSPQGTTSSVLCTGLLRARSQTTRCFSTTLVSVNVFSFFCFFHVEGKTNTNLPTGHGGQTEDLDGDEDDGYDEVIYPVDFRANGHIVDDDMHLWMVQPLQAGVRLTAIFDSCHSGTALDLPYVYSTSGVLKEPNLAKEAGVGLLGAVQSYARGDLGGVATSLFGFAKKAFSDKQARDRTMRTKTSPADVISWSGSKDDQTS